MLKKVSLAVAVLFVVLVAVVISRPDTYHVERSQTVGAPADIVFAHVADFHAWADWSPWEKLDPSMKKSFEGPAQGAGASYAWEGSDQVGKGKMTLTEVLPPSSLTIRLDFIEPFASTATTRFTFAGEGTGTKVTWAMEGQNDFMGKAFGMFMDMDKMIGADFEKGLGQLKTVVEADAKKKAAEVTAAAAPTGAEATPEPSTP
jgi:hypothetical protein